MYPRSGLGGKIFVIGLLQDLVTPAWWDLINILNNSHLPYPNLKFSAPWSTIHFSEALYPWGGSGIWVVCPGTLLILDQILKSGSVPNQKWTHLNDTYSRILLITKPASQETSINNIQNYLRIYWGSITWFQNMIKNKEGPRTDYSTPWSLLRVESFTKVYGYS